MKSIPHVGLGTWKSPRSEELVKAIVYAVTEAGYTHIDCAEVYGNEDIVGQALEKVFNMGIKREQLWITSKLWSTHHRPGQVEQACRNTLKNLKIDYLDLYLMHQPMAFDPEKPQNEKGGVNIDETITFIDTWREMEKLVEKRLVRHIGASNFTINHLQTLKYAEGIKIRPYTNQVEFSLYMQQTPLRNYMHEEGIIITAYSPCGSPDQGDQGLPVLLKDEVLAQVAKEVGKTPCQVALRFLLALEPAGAVIPKSLSPAHIKENIDLDFELTYDQFERLKQRERCTRYASIQRVLHIDFFADGHNTQCVKKN